MAAWMQTDERSENITGRLALVFLGLTQAGLLFLIIYQRYVQGRPPIYYNDLALIFAISTVGYWLLNFFLGGVLLELSARTILAAYLGLVVMIALPHILIRGLPDREILATWIGVSFGGPAILVAGHALAAYLGKKRLDRLSAPKSDS